MLAAAHTLALLQWLPDITPLPCCAVLLCRAVSVTARFAVLPCSAQLLRCAVLPVCVALLLRCAVLPVYVAMLLLSVLLLWSQLTQSWLTLKLCLLVVVCTTIGLMGHTQGGELVGGRVDLKNGQQGFERVRLVGGQGDWRA